MSFEELERIAKQGRSVESLKKHCRLLWELVELIASVATVFLVKQLRQRESDQVLNRHRWQNDVHVCCEQQQQIVREPAGGRTTTTTWNYENQPTVFHMPDGSRVTMTYNANNRRVDRE
jgi:YD repeat-containing protein